MTKVYFILSFLVTLVFSKYKYPYEYVVSLEGYSSNLVFDKRLCTGSLIAQNWILTAAHCIDRQITRARFDYTPKSLKRRILKKIPHPGYRKVYEDFKHVYSVNDISLFLAEDMYLKNYVEIAPLYYNTMISLPIKCVTFGITVITPKHRDSLPDVDGSVVKCKGPTTIGPAICTLPKCGLRFSKAPLGDVGGVLLYEDQIIGVAGMTMTTERSMEKFLPASIYLGWIHSVLNSSKINEYRINLV